MARFRLSYVTDRGRHYSNLSHRGHEVNVNGWSKGIKVISETDSNGRDMFTVLLTGGSNRPGLAKLLVRIRDDIACEGNCESFGTINCERCYENYEE